MTSGAAPQSEGAWYNRDVDGRRRRHSLPAGVLPTDASQRPEDRGSRIRARAPAGPTELDRTVGPPPPARRARALVDELVTLGPGDTAAAIRRLLPLGNFALEELSRSFPGPLWRPSLVTDSRLPRAAEISASAEAIVAFEREAIPYLGKLIRHPTSEVRYYAAVICNELRSRDLVEPIAKLTLDEDRDCRRIALHLLAGYQHEPVYREAVAMLRQSAADHDRSLGTRRRAVSALTQLRDDASAALFVELLTDPDRGIATACRVGLRVLTAHDFGFAREPWLRWLAERGQEIRIQWLIEGLGDGRINIRVLASRELWRLTRFLQPLTESAGRAEFVDAQRHYERWWSKRHVD